MLLPIWRRPLLNTRLWLLSIWRAIMIRWVLFFESDNLSLFSAWLVLYVHVYWRPWYDSFYFSSQFFTMYTALLLSPNYVTKRQSLKLLGEILLDRTNFNVMTRYISSEDNLKMMMNLLRDKSKNIQFEAFHVFKVSLSFTNLPFSFWSSLSLQIFLGPLDPHWLTTNLRLRSFRSSSQTQRNHQSSKTSFVVIANV